MISSAPIGIFDSGIGGLTVAAALGRALPNESMIYVGDTAHLPYGDKSAEAIQSYALGIARFLYESGCKMIVVACNSASATAFEALRTVWGGQILLVDVISPLVRTIAQQGFGKVGVIATKATVRTDIYTRALQQLQPDLEVASLATALLAPMIEEGFFNDAISQTVIHQYLSYPDFEDIEAILLACTHYPLIRPQIEAYWGGRVQIFDSIAPVLAEVRRQLEANDLLNPHPQQAEHQFWVTDYTQSFAQTTRIFYQNPVPLRVLPWEGDVLRHDGAFISPKQSVV